MHHRSSCSEANSFTAEVGIRQGCPISPLLFVIVLDVFLRHLSHTVPHLQLRAFADDIGIVVRTRDQLLAVMKAFSSFGNMSNLRLNLDKTVVVPLGTFGCIEEARLFLAHSCVHLSRCVFDSAAKYLGVWMGPDSQSRNWMEQNIKVQARCRQWKNAATGLHYGCRIYRTFVFSIWL